MTRDYESLNIAQVGGEIDPFTEDRYRQFYRFMDKGASNILDIGCSTGRGGKILKMINDGFAITGLDIVENRVERLPRDVYKNIMISSSTEIPSEDYSFDVVLAGEFVEHLYHVDVDKTLAEIFRVLKIGGQILLTTPNPGYLKRRMRGESILGGAHVSQHHHDALKMKLKMIGFARVKICGSGRVSRYLGYRFPLLSLYGSYLASGYKV